MTLPIRELKRRYKLNLALGHTLPTFDLAIPLPFSTGTPLFDAALTEKLSPTVTLNEPEHLGRAWRLVREASPEQRAVLARHAGILLNDFKLLLALRAWELGDTEQTQVFLRALPWGWRLGFPIAAIKPAAQIFTGWRRSLRFRLIDDPRFPELRELFRELLARAPGPAILKYRQTIKASAALLHLRFEGERERALHDLCFDDGSSIQGHELPEPIGTYLRARHALSGGIKPFLDALTQSPAVIPITSFMGMLGGTGVRLTDNGPYAAELRNYAVRCATAVESLLRLAEWAPWLTEAHTEQLGRRVRETIIDQGLDIPFFKVTKAFMNAPLRVRRLVLEPLYTPLLQHFGRQVAGMLDAPQPLTLVQPGNVLHLMSFLLYTTISSAAPARMLLLYRNGVEELPPLDLPEVARHLADEPQQFQSWLLHEFGGLAATREYIYDYPAIGRTLAQVDPQTPLLLDLPFAEGMDVLNALLPFEQVFNLNTAFGAPGEVCIAYEYYQVFGLALPQWNFSVWERYSDSAAQKFAEFLDRLRAFRTLAEGAA